MSFTTLQKHREAARARLLVDDKVRGRIAFRAFEIYQQHGDGHGGALSNWLQAEEEVISSLVEQELRVDSQPTDSKGLKGKLGKLSKPRVKRGKKSQSRAASLSDTASKRKAKTNEAAPTNAESAKNETKPSRAAKGPSDASAKRKGRNEVESQSV